MNALYRMVKDLAERGYLELAREIAVKNDLLKLVEEIALAKALNEANRKAAEASARALGRGLSADEKGRLLQGVLEKGSLKEAEQFVGEFFKRTLSDDEIFTGAIGELRWGFEKAAKTVKEKIQHPEKMKQLAEAALPFFIREGDRDQAEKAASALGRNELTKEEHKNIAMSCAAKGWLASYLLAIHSAGAEPTEEDLKLLLNAALRQSNPDQVIAILNFAREML